MIRAILVLLSLVMKLLSLVTLAAGVFMISFSQGCPICTSYWGQFLEAMDGYDGLMKFIPVAGGVLALVGLYGILPRLPKRAPKAKLPTSISYELEHGEVQVELKPIEERLKQVLIRMPEIKKISVKVAADEDSSRIRIASDVVLHSNVNVPAREIQNLINKYIVETATSIFGLEVVQPIKLTIRGITLSPKAASKVVRAGIARGQEAAVAGAAGVAAGVCAVEASAEAPEMPCCMECAEAAAQAIEAQAQPEAAEDIPVAAEEAEAPPAEDDEKDPWS